MVNQKPLSRACGSPWNLSRRGREVSGRYRFFHLGHDDPLRCFSPLLKAEDGPLKQKRGASGGNRSASLVHGVEETYFFGCVCGCVLALCFLL
jgi:hypothetical protein